MRNAGFDVSTTTVDVSSRDSVVALVETATTYGDVTGLIHAAGVSPSQAPIEAILAVDLYGTAVVLDEFGRVIARGGAGVVIASQSGHRLGALTPEQNAALATVPADDLLKLPILQPDQVTDTLHAYQLAKRGNALRVMAEAVRWAKRGARGEHHQPRHHHHPSRQGRAYGSSWRGVSADDRTVSGRTGWNTGRARHSGSPPYEFGRSVYHRKRLPDRRRRHGFLLLWRPRARVIGLGSISARFVPDLQGHSPGPACGNVTPTAATSRLSDGRE
jgi:hypothetical protein